MKPHRRCLQRTVNIAALSRPVQNVLMLPWQAWKRARKHAQWQGQPHQYMLSQIGPMSHHAPSGANQKGWRFVGFLKATPQAIRSEDVHSTVLADRQYKQRWNSKRHWSVFTAAWNVTLSLRPRAAGILHRNKKSLRTIDHWTSSQPPMRPGPK